jgi:hypothetical protein
VTIADQAPITQGGPHTESLSLTFSGQGLSAARQSLWFRPLGMRMNDSPSTPDASKRMRDLVVGLFIKAVAGLILVFVIAAVAAPRLFNVHEDFATILAFALWIACPLLLFLIGWELFAEIRKFNERSPPP